MAWLYLIFTLAFAVSPELAEKAFYSTVLIQLPENSRCTGVLIDENTVLTAAHCVQKPGFIQDLSVLLPILNSEKTFVQDTVYKVILHPQFNYKSKPVDLAVIILNKPIPQKLNKARIPFDLKDSPELSSLQDQALLMGYGITAKARMNPELDRNPIIRGKIFDLKTSQMEGDYFLLDNRSAQACTGDSGGPLIGMTPSGSYQLMGIITKVLAHRGRFRWDQFLFYSGIRKTANQVCTGKAEFLNIKAYADWIQQVKASSSAPIILP